MMQSQAFLPVTRPSIDEETIQGVTEVLRSGWLTSGPQVKAFEQALSAYFDGRPVRVMNSGTAALEIALHLAGVAPGDEVITTPITWVATANVVLRAGARPVFVDIDPATRNIDVDRIEAAITERTRALLPVDLAGLPVDRDRLYDIAHRHGLRVIEDAAQSMGAAWRKRRIGSFGDLVAISFHANKNMTTGEGGCLVLPSEDDVSLCERLRLQGMVRDADGGMDVDLPGGKFNLTDIGARIGLGQLRRLEGFNEQRRRLARRYFERFAAVGAGLRCGLPLADFDNGNWHMFQVTLPLAGMSIGRGDFIRAMANRGIGVGVHYPAIHLYTAYRRFGWRDGDLPHAERVGREIVTLPLFPAMIDGDVDRVVTAIAEVLNQHTR